MYVLDTNVLSEARRPSPNRRMLAWLASVPDHRLHISVIVIGEIRRGILMRAKTNPHDAQRLDLWLDELIDDYAFGDRLLPVTLEDALTWGRITAGNKHLPEADALIAAQALSRDWTVVTRNARDFERTGARLLNPFEFEG
ncbi:type II toxin-antitoxin system VapC family toxin [Actinocrinis puniceicyclus]|uniref:Ribonuclease VapC n=1 Tax=Actinocrinis puniceicyclus TaxID=977794 RepID=A0A8J8BAP7_9ACTN|nr:type II toxin-antitoxin system VapC family toxin [Actinocrinis puniceicyclus]MBS2961615.1 type II toxin-antitoxin system VapC family toxin [Actinocrinis puniceicyclus]